MKNSDTLIELSNVKNTCEQCSVDDEGNTDFCDTHRKHFNEFVEDMPDMDKVL